MRPVNAIPVEVVTSPRPGPASSVATDPRHEPVVAVVPAKDEEHRIAATVWALRRLGSVARVVVIDDGSTDATASAARAAGAHVVSHARNRGKGAAMQTGALAAGPALLLFADADLEDTAGALAALIEPVRAGAADMSIAVLPAQRRRRGGGRGFVVDLARRGIEDLTGVAPEQPLSGQRCLTPEAFARARPLAAGWGVEVGLTIDLLRAGDRIAHVPCALQHRVTGGDWRGQVHRARQYRDVWRALAARGHRRLPLT